MSADVFHHYAQSCPLCGRGNSLSINRLQGRLVCPYCNSSLVVSEGGQFVRDPFVARPLKPLLSIQQLRRQSSPIARMFRDAQPSIRVLLGTIVLLLLLGTMLSKVSGGTVNQLLQPLSLQTSNK
jgi:transposase-like protein